MVTECSIGGRLCVDPPDLNVYTAADVVSCVRVHTMDSLQERLEL